MDRFLKELQSDGVGFRGEHVILAKNGDLVGKYDPGTAYSTYHVFDDYSRKEMTYDSIAPRAAKIATKTATGIAATVKDAYDAIDDKVVEPIDENVLKPVFDALGAAVKYAADTAEACVDEFMLAFGVAQRATLNKPRLAMATYAEQADIEAYWNGRTFNHSEADEESETLTEQITGFFSRLWG